MKKVETVLASCGILCGFAFAAAAYSEGKSAALIGKNGGTTVGTITGIESERNEHGDFFRPIVKFEDLQRVTHSFKGNYSQKRPLVGSRPRVAYSVSDSTFATLADERYEGYVFQRAFAAFIFFMVFGMFLLDGITGGRDRASQTQALGSER